MRLRHLLLLAEGRLGFVERARFLLQLIDQALVAAGDPSEFAGDEADTILYRNGGHSASRARSV